MREGCKSRDMGGGGRFEVKNRIVSLCLLEGAADVLYLFSKVSDKIIS